MIALRINLRNIIALLISFVLIFYPLDQLYDALNNGMNSTSPLRILILALVPLVFFNLKRKLPFKYFFGFSFILIAFNFLSGFWSINEYLNSIRYSLKLLSFFCFSYLACIYFLDKQKLVLKIIFYMTLISGIAALIGFSGVISITGDLASERILFQGLGINALSISLGYSLVCGIALFFFKEIGRFQKLLLIFTCILILMFSFKAGTRSVAWGVFVAFGFSYSISYKLFNFRSFILFIFAGIILFFFFSFFFQSGYIDGRLSDRMMDVNMQTLSTNSRWILWRKGIEFFLSNPMGAGSGNEVFVYRNLLHSNNFEAHNVFVSALVQTGLFGFILIVCSLLSLIYYILKVERKCVKFLLLFLFTFFFLQILKGSSLQTRLFWHPIILILSIISSRIGDVNKSYCSKAVEN